MGGSEPVVDLVCYMILYEFDKKKRRDFKPIVDLTFGFEFWKKKFEKKKIRKKKILEKKILEKKILEKKIKKKKNFEKKIFEIFFFEKKDGFSGPVVDLV